MKKLIAVLLALVCAFSACSLAAGAVNEGIIDNIFDITTEVDEADKLSYGIHYTSGDLVTVTVLYEPSPNIRFEVPTYVKVTGDTPVAVDHNWVCWKNQETGELFYPGDEIYVDGKITLVAVWEEKTDNYPRFVRSAIAGFQALLKLIEKFFNFFDVINNATPSAPTEPATTAPSTTEPTTIYIPEIVN